MQNEIGTCAIGAIAAAAIGDCAPARSAIKGALFPIMKSAVRPRLPLQLLAVALFIGACATPPQGIHRGHSHGSASAPIDYAAEPPGDYYIGRRYYKQVYKFWGYVRRPGQPWSTAQLVMMNEQQKLAPDRQANQLGSDNNYEYKLIGGFSGDRVYEPASNSIYPEFVLKDYELISRNPPPIFKSQAGGAAAAAVKPLQIERPQ
jgi:hypothetical protein